MFGSITLETKIIPNPDPDREITSSNKYLVVVKIPFSDCRKDIGIDRPEVLDLLKFGISDEFHIKDDVDLEVTLFFLVPEHAYAGGLEFIEGLRELLGIDRTEEFIQQGKELLQIGEEGDWKDAQRSIRFFSSRA